MNRQPVRLTLTESSHLEELYQQYAPMGLRFVEGMLGNRSDAEELVQEAFLRLLKSDSSTAESVRKNEIKFQPIFFTTLRNLAIDNIRRRQRMQQKPMESTPEPMVVQSDDQTKLIGQNIERLLRLMPENWANAIRIRTENNLSYDQIAMRLGASKNQVRTWIFRGRVFLRDELRKLDLMS